MALVDPRVVFFSEQTQETVNRLPQWHAGRRLRTSNWSKLTNAWLGMALEDYQVQSRRAFRNLFIQTAHLDEPDLLQAVNLPQGVDLTAKTENVNRLRNGDFSLRARPDKVGDFWSHTGIVGLSDVALFGALAPFLFPSPSTTSQIAQEVKTDPWPKNTSRTFSAWYRIATWAGGTVPAASHGLLVLVTYADNTTQLFRTAFASDTADQWRRVLLTITPIKDVAKYTVRLETARSGSFDLTVPVRVDAVQVQAGQVASTWEPNLSDVPNWFQSELVSPILFDAEAPIFVTDSLRDFYFEAVPTRASLFRTESGTFDAERGGGIGEAVDFFKQRWAFTWDVDTTLNKVRKIGINPQDIYATYDLSFFTGTGDGPRFEEGLSGLTYRAVTHFQRWLFVIHEMLGLDGTSKVCLSIADALTPHPAPTHLEVKQTLELPIPAGVDYRRLEVRFEDPQFIYVASATTEYAIRLKYDYAMIEASTLRAFFRERYPALGLVR